MKILKIKQQLNLIRYLTHLVQDIQELQLFLYNSEQELQLDHQLNLDKSLHVFYMHLPPVISKQRSKYPVKNNIKTHFTMIVL